MSADDTYAPKSPDLSSFYSAGPTQTAPQQFHAPTSHDTHARSSEHKLEQHPGSDIYSYAPPYPQLLPQTTTASIHEPRLEPDYLPTPQHHHLQFQQQLLQQQQHLQHHHYQQTHPHPHAHPHPHQHQQPEQHQGHPYAHAANPGLSASPQKQAFSLQAPSSFVPPQYGQQYPIQAQSQYPPGHYAPPYAQGPPDSLSTIHAQPSTEMPPRKAAVPPPAPFIDPSPVRTKFPTARRGTSQKPLM